VGPKPDAWIRLMADRGMIHPFVDHLVREEHGKRVISYGVSSYGYDLRVSNRFKLIINAKKGISVVDPKGFDDEEFVDIEVDEYVIIPPNSFALGVSIEHFAIPLNVMAFCVGKSTYARCGVVVNWTSFQAGWEGFATLEISNTTPLPVKIYAREGLAQIVFFEGEGSCDVSYKDSQGKYMCQSGVTLPQV